MKKFYAVMLMLFAVIAFGAVVAGSASAETTLGAEWLENGSAITTTKASETVGALLLEDKTVKAAVICHGSLDGTVGATGQDEITEVLNVAKEAVSTLGNLALLGTGSKLPDCETETGCAEGTAASPIEVWPVGLPWKTQLFTMENGSVLDLIENFGYEMLCLVLSINAEDACSAADTNLLVQNNAAGDASTPSGSVAEPLANCTLGGAESGVNQTVGESKINLVSGVLLSVNAL